MKIKKTISERALAANRENAKKSTGPRRNSGSAAPKYNAEMHRLLSKRLVFRSDEEKADYDELLARLTKENPPADSLEAMALVEIARNWWKLQDCDQWEETAIRSRRAVTLSAMRSCAFQSLDFMNTPPIFIDDSDNPPEGTAAAWDCTELALSAGHSAGRREEESGVRGGWADKENRSLMGIRLTSSFESIVRYSSSIKPTCTVRWLSLNVSKLERNAKTDRKRVAVHVDYK